MRFLSYKIFFIALFFINFFPLNSFAKQSIFEIAYEVSSYTYKEPHLSNPISLKGNKQGVSIFSKSYGLWGNEINSSSFEFRYMSGKTDYNGWMCSGEICTPFEYSGIQDYYLEGTAKMGRIFYNQEDLQIEGNLGLGYRYLKDNLQSIGAGGYLRKSRYIYVPFEAIFKYKISESFGITLKTEFDWLLSGEQYSGKIAGYSDSTDVSHRQEQGYGLRASLKLSSLVHNMEFFVEPFWRYWHIQNSESEYQYVQIGGDWYQQLTYEPFNTTQEYGVKIGIGF
jgi:hypothetical protein